MASCSVRDGLAVSAMVGGASTTAWMFHLPIARPPTCTRTRALAERITTDATGLVAGEVKIGEIPAYRAMPEGKGPFPLVLVVQEIFGVHEHIKDVCRRLAKAGYNPIIAYLGVAPAHRDHGYGHDLLAAGRFP